MALVAALGVALRKPKNWPVCHIWGYDEASASQSGIVRNPRYYWCAGNMVSLPTPLKGFTDALPTCAFHLTVRLTQEYRNSASSVQS